MDEVTLSSEEKREIEQALAGAPDDLKQKFCGCWPAVKGLLEWLAGRAGGPAKWLLTKMINLGDWLYRALDCEAKGEAG